MRRVLTGLASLALVLLSSVSLVAERPGPGTLDGYVHDITNPLSEAPGRTFGLFPAGDPTGKGVVVLVAGGHTQELVEALGARVLVTGNWLETVPGSESQSFAVEQVMASGGHDLIEQIRKDLAARGDVFGELGSEAPQGGFDADRLLCPSGKPARVLPIELPPQGTADFFTVTAYLCADTGSYWAQRTGGIAGLVRWVGPFDVPRDVLPKARSEDAPTRVSPRTLRTGRHDRKRRVTVKRRVRDDDTAPLDTSRYTVDDFDLGQEVHVLRVVRARRKAVQLRVLVEARAQRGERTVRVLGRAGDATLRVR